MNAIDQLGNFELGHGDINFYQEQAFALNPGQMIGGEFYSDNQTPYGPIETTESNNGMEV